MYLKKKRSTKILSRMMINKKIKYANNSWSIKLIFIFIGTGRSFARSFSKEHDQKKKKIYFSLEHDHEHVHVHVHEHNITYKVLTWKISWDFFYQKGNFFEFHGNFTCVSITKIG